MGKKFIDNGSLRYAFIGGTGTGKTTKQSQLAYSWLQSGGRVLVLPSAPEEDTFKAIPRIKIDQVPKIPMGQIYAYDCEDTKDFGQVLQMARNMLVVCDDTKSYMPYNRMDGQVRKALIASRFRSVYYSFAMHGFTQVPPDLFTYIDFIYLFRSSDSPSRAKQNFRKYEEIIEAQERVNQKANENQYYFEILNNQIWGNLMISLYCFLVKLL